MKRGKSSGDFSREGGNFEKERGNFEGETEYREGRVLLIPFNGAFERYPKRFHRFLLESLYNFLNSHVEKAFEASLKLLYLGTLGRRLGQLVNLSAIDQLFQFPMIILMILFLMTGNIEEWVVSETWKLFLLFDHLY